MWTKENRGRYDRNQQRYPSDLTVEEWGLVEPLRLPANRGGGKRSVDMREVVNGRSKLCKQRLRRVMDILSTGCQWRYLRKDRPSKSTVFRYFDLWNYDGTLLRLHHELYVLCRKQAGRSPTVAIIDSQSVKSTETLRQAQEGARINPHGDDAGQKINGKKRHIAIDTLGLNLEAVVRPADIQDRDGGPLVLKELRPRFPLITKIIADGGYQGPQMAAAVAAIGREWDIEIVKRPALRKFVVLPQRGVVDDSTRSP